MAKQTACMHGQAELVCDIGTGPSVQIACQSCLVSCVLIGRALYRVVRQCRNCPTFFFGFFVTGQNANGCGLYCERPVSRALNVLKVPVSRALNVLKVPVSRALNVLKVPVSRALNVLKVPASATIDVSWFQSLTDANMVHVQNGDAV